MTARRFLLVPIHMDALWLDQKCEVAGPSLDLFKAPWYGKDAGIQDEVERDHFSDTANVSAAMRIKPMEPTNHYLDGGLHLHWSLPDALTHGHSKPGNGRNVERAGMYFPCAPNRWLVTRTVGGKSHAWLVQSDFVHPWEEQDQGVPYPIGEHQHWPYPTCRIGRAVDLADGDGAAQSAYPLEKLDAKLTAVGPKDPTFAALYPSCHSVFGLHLRGAPPADGAEFEAFGWYADPEDDPINDWTSHADVAQDIPSEIRQVDEGEPLLKHANWAVGDDVDPSAAAAMICYARLNLKIESGQDATPAAPTGKLAVGSSTQEALAALVAQGDPDLEDTIEAIRFGSYLSDHTIDHGHKLAEARHTAGFLATGARTIWSIRPNAADNIRNDQQQTTLTHRLAHVLNQLNEAQKDLDDKRDEEASLKQTLYSDWYCYMLAAYPSDDHADFALDVDVIRDHVLDDTKHELRACQLEIQELLNETNQLKRQAQDELKRADPEQKLKLDAVPGPRYWQPGDPILAVERGDALTLSRRHGLDAEGPLPCLLTSAIETPVGREWRQFREDVRRETQREHAKNFNTIAAAEQGPAPWNPILLEWRANLRALVAGTNLVWDERQFAQDVITAHFTLDPEGADLLPSGEGAEIVAEVSEMIQNGHDVHGRSVLHTHSGQLMRDALTKFTSYKTGKPAQTNHLEALNNWTKMDHDGSYRQVVTVSLDGLNERLLMKRLEPQLPIADPLGFESDKRDAASVRRHVGEAARLYSPEPDAPFMPLRACQLLLRDAKVIDNFGRALPWTFPNGTKSQDPDIWPAKSVRSEDGKSVLLGPRSAQPARLDFRWMSADFGDVESNDHAATTPLCGWLVPNLFDLNVQVYDSAGTALGLINEAGIWHPAPGNPDAPAGPMAIGNPYLARVAEWFTSQPADGFIRGLLALLDETLRGIEPKDHASHKARSLLAGRPVAIARVRLDLRVQGQTATDVSEQSMALRISGAPRDDHGFSQVRFPIRLGESGQWNDGLIGYFEDPPKPGPYETLVAARNARTELPSGVLPHRPLAQSFDDAPADLTLLLDPRAPVHATTGILPTKAISIPRDQFMPSMRDIDLMFQARPILTPATNIHLPLPSEPDVRWSWLALEEGKWRETPAEPQVTLEDLERAYPGTVKDTDPPMTRGAQLMKLLLDVGWLSTRPGSGGALRPDPNRIATRRNLGKHWDPDQVEITLTKIARHIRPVDRHATIGPRPVLREGWLVQKTVRANPQPPVAPSGSETNPKKESKP